jgi:hypothetical protein
MQPSQRLATATARAAASFRRAGTSLSVIVVSCNDTDPDHASGMAWRSDRVGPHRSVNTSR